MAIYQHDWSAKWAVYFPEKIAFKEFETNRTLTYSQLNRLGNRTAHFLTRHFGLEKGDRVAVLAENCLEYMCLFAAAQKAGFILVPLNYRLAPPELDYMLALAEPKLALAESKFQHLFDATVAFHTLPHRWSLEALAQLLSGEEMAGFDQPFPPVPIDDDDPIFILFTSGTTGFPKGALYTHGMLFWNSVNTAMSLIVNTESRTLNVMPPFHTGGWNVLTTPFWHHGGYTCMLKKFDPGVVLRLLEAEACTIFMGVPTMLKMLADHPDFERADLSQLFYIIVGGEPMPIPLIEKWHAKGVFIRQGYGMTEVGPNLTSLHQRDAVRKKGSIGRPNFYVEIRIVDEHGNDLPPNQPGELLLRGPMVTPGYWRNPEATRSAFFFGEDTRSSADAGLPSTRGAWFRTGDLVRQDEEGYLFVVDRLKNMFISGGENVYPAEIERVLVQHPAVSEAAVVGVPDERWGEVGKAFVVVKAGLAQGLAALEQALVQFCADRLAKYKIPKYFVFLDALPKNDTGKIDRKALKALGPLRT
ncbi:MAG: long-chain fatty acid--CoA ligase [Saprospiraceae bacterium]|nr:long-chain fatty acid--CoA ligase [Saprospiraceae bacterium]MDW8484874.1 long-chain fatty acid--CoA ligase [Saprospiraceae bacterium]